MRDGFEYQGSTERHRVGKRFSGFTPGGGGDGDVLWVSVCLGDQLLRVYDELRQDNFSLRILMSTPEFLSRSSAIHDVLQSLYARGQLKLIVVDEVRPLCARSRDMSSTKQHRCT